MENDNRLVAEKLFNRDELRRLEKAAKEKDKRKLLEWAEQFQAQLMQDLEKQYNKMYSKDIGDGIDNFIVAIAYTLHFSEETKFGKKRLNRFMQDIYATVDLFKTKEENPISYMEQLKEDGIDFLNSLLEERKEEGGIKND